MTEEIEYLFKKLEEKKNEPMVDKEKLKYAEGLLEIPDVFFKINLTTAAGLLDFLGIPHDEMKELYYKLISPESYQNVVGKTYLCIPPKE